jgi:hypothetical protein
MKCKLITLSALMACTAIHGQVPPIEPKVMSEMLTFDKAVILECRLQPPPRKTKHPNPFGTPVWVFDYTAKTQTLHSYSIAVFPGGSLFGERRAEMETAIREQIKKLGALGGDVRREGIGIETSEDGREVFFTVMGFGPGGTAYGGFTTLPNGKYDLLVMHMVDHEDDMPQEQKLKDPARPGKQLMDIFGEIEKAVLQAIENDANKGLLRTGDPQTVRQSAEP